MQIKNIQLFIGNPLPLLPQAIDLIPIPLCKQRGGVTIFEQKQGKIIQQSTFWKFFEVIYMKRVSFAGLGAFALIATVPFVGQIPGIANVWHSGSAVAQNIKNQGQIQLRLEAEKQVVAKDQQGKQSQKWEPLKGQAVVRPGDVLRYTLSASCGAARRCVAIYLEWRK